MAKRSLTQSCLRAFGVLTLVAFTGCAEFNDPYYSGYDSGYSDPYYDYGRRDDRRYRNEYERRREHEERREDRREIERERRRVEEERRQLEEQRAREAARNRAPSRQNDRCPAGFSPSENKCSPQERKRGCRDIRLPSGLGCVSR